MGAMRLGTRLGIRLGVHPGVGWHGKHGEHGDCGTCSWDEGTPKGNLRTSWNSQPDAYARGIRKLA